MILIYTSKNIKHKAESVIHEHGTNNVYQICENLRIVLLKEDLGCINGFLQYYKERETYLIHVNKNSVHPDLIIAHELGHYYLHKNLNSFQMENCSLVLGNKLEIQANAFATELLLPDYIISNELPKLQNWTLKQIASFFQLPLFVIKNKLEHINLLSQHLSDEEERLAKFVW
ncbi:ImmA/IrrE family metallo-endopeptidase [Bacillus amyloliquefaciens]|uniref:ImmA/IrrE family metallo-endopeptidase n=1 Tax=Bacillus amyloliquefaciens TaxID=1390 RepID=UPI001ABBE7F9|nr:ImmA/IrrE family metallo-endopeptidase [Bacillus amyloliquefaciens]MBO3652552.1 ImmA/IrrE family metallo-endopeptidase [Bacillus amyloliquefaciens]MCJ2176408.1 ImmA/IrrE family metallo-endopeptidase [Bacillus amyloliquefaciens]MCR4351066.1 ImmA/IrrE family metallo-endopeptidase [Bacillus amyloliquefaciens]MCR4358919.1 ImmA/IrrE family metallo-endopeptidase [Bacillus amyloliquefaciens]